SGDDDIYGEEGNDSITGGPGADRVFGGDGSDQFLWNPGDGSDLVEGGGDEADLLRFNGNAGIETFHLFANLLNGPPRAMLTRDVGTVAMDIAGVEEIQLNADAGTDTIVVGRSDIGTLADLSTTDVKAVDVELGFADGLDNVTFEGRPADDNLVVSAEGSVVKVAGLSYDLRIGGIEPLVDRLTVRGNAGHDTIAADTGFAAILLTLEGGSGNDSLQGGAGGDSLLGDAGDDTLAGLGGNDTFFGGAGEDLLTGGTGDNTYNGGTDFDTVLIQGTSGNDVIDVSQPADTTLVSTVNGGIRTDTLVTLAGVGTVEAARIEAGAGDDVIRVTLADALSLDAVVNSLRVDVIGGTAFTRDRLAVVDDGLGDVTIYRKGELDSTGTITIGPALAEPLNVNFEGIEFVQPLAGPAGRVFVFKHDPFEFNDTLFNATFLGAGATINVDPTIDPGGFAPFGLPGDEDWFQFTAAETGTFDFQVYFDELLMLGNGRLGLPGGGDLAVQVFDSDGLPFFIGTATPLLDPAGNKIGERFAMSVIRNQTYHLRVVGATVDAVNIYNFTVINVPAPVPQ
ncbi:MAG: calcium-binding protein, partial [Vicinamibacterales bacterium]